MKRYHEGEWKPVSGQPGPTLHVDLRLIPIVLLSVLFVAWVVLGGPAYTVAADEEAVVLTFGKYTATTQPGLNFKFPWPIQTVEKVKVGESKRLEIGFRSEGAGERGATRRSFVEDEARMLTGDENIVDTAMAVQYRITNPLDYLFNFEEDGPASVEGTLSDIGEAALRLAVGDHPIDDVLTTGKTEIQNEVQQKMQQVADLYRMGVTVTAVQLQDVQPPADVADAFLDVATAREEREEKINQAKAYTQDKVPKAEGAAAKLLQEAQGYKAARVAEAEGAVARFAAVAEQYALAPDITKTRLYLETFEKLLPNLRITVVDEDAGVLNLNTIAGGMLGAGSSRKDPETPTGPPTGTAPLRAEAR